MRRLFQRAILDRFAHLAPSLRATALYALGILWSRGVGLLMVPVLTAHLQPGAFGRLELLSSAAEIGGLMVAAGLVETLFRFADPRTGAGRRAAADVMGLALTFGTAAFLALAWFGGDLAAAMPLATPPVEIWLLGTTIVMDAVVGVALGWLRMTGRAGRHAVVSGLRASVQAATSAILLILGFGVGGVLAGGAVAAVLAAGVLIRMQARDTGIGVHPRAWPRLLTYGVPLLGTGIASFVLGSADRWLLADSAPAAVAAVALGNYALATRFAMIVVMLMQPFDMWWYARRMSLLGHAEGLARTARAVRLGMAGIAAASCVTAALGPPAIALLAPSSYAPARAMLPWIVLSLAIQMLSSLVNAGCYAGRSTRLALLVNAAAAVVALALYLALIPRLGVAGAIIATLVAQTLRLVLFTVLAQRIVRVDLPYGRTLVLAACAAAVAATPQLLAEYGDHTIGFIAAASAAAALAGVAAAGWTIRQVV